MVQSTKTWAFAFVLGPLLLLAADNRTLSGEPQRPTIRKLGTLDLDMVETTPVVFRDRLYCFEYVRPGYRSQQDRRLLLSASSTWRPARRPLHLPRHSTWDVRSPMENPCGSSAWINWDGENIFVFRSNDLEHWEQRPALKLPGWGLFNTSVCKAGNRYVMAIEVGKPPEVVGVPFTMRFAESKNLLDWSLLPKECVYTKERYSACPALRFLDGWFYMTYLEARPGPNYETYLVRSRRPDPLGVEPAQPSLESVTRRQADRQPEADRRPAGEDRQSGGPEQLRRGPVRVPRARRSSPIAGATSRGRSSLPKRSTTGRWRAS